MLDEAARTLWQRFDAVVVPTVPVLPPRVTDLTDNNDEFGRVNALILCNSSVFNFLDSCALPLPCHLRTDAPVGLMLAAAPHADDVLLSIGSGAEAVLNAIR